MFCFFHKSSIKASYGEFMNPCSSSRATLGSLAASLKNAALALPASVVEQTCLGSFVVAIVFAFWNGFRMVLIGAIIRLLHSPITEWSAVFLDLHDADYQLE